MDERADSMEDFNSFFVVYCENEYRQMEITEADRAKAIFFGRHGLFRCFWTPLGLKSASASFQQAGDNVLSRTEWNFALVYLGEIIIYSESAMGHLVHMRIVLTTLRNDGVTLKLSKCFFFDSVASYLRSTIRLEELTVYKKTCKAVTDTLPSTNRAELRSFLRICDMYHHFVHNFAQRAAQQSIRTRKKQRFEFELNFVEIDKFHEFKEHVMSLSILAPSWQGQRYTLSTGT